MKIKYSTRLVFVFKKIVVKIPLSKRGYLQGKNERDLHEKYKGKGLLGELIFEKFGMVIMKTYPLASRIPGYVVYGIKKEIPELNILNCDLHNVKNWGIDENSNPILIDYGVNQYISTLY
jgi:hypothetical protein